MIRIIKMPITTLAKSEPGVISPYPTVQTVTII